MATSTNYNLVPVDVSPSLLYSNLAASSHGIVRHSTSLPCTTLSNA